MTTTKIAIEKKTADLEKDLISIDSEFKELGVVPDNDEVLKSAVKAIVESESFKALTESLSTLMEGIKELKETAIPGIVTRLEAVEQTAKNAETKAQKSVDDIVAEAITSKSQAFRASQEGKEPTKEEKAKEGETQVSAPIDEHFAMAFNQNAKR